MKCYNCGNEVIIGDNPDIGICSVCLSEIPLPKGEKSIQDAYSEANELLSESRFEEAREAFREILVRDTFESAAYWGMATAEYGIEFVQDPATFELLPTLHRLSTERFSEHLYVKKALEYATSPAKIQFYTEQSKLIDQIQSQSLQISQKEEPYDVFICYKKTEEGEKRTADSRMAGDFYKELVRRGYKVFFAEQTLTVGEEYEPRIFAALHSARVLIAIGSRREYYDAVWVKNEWSRYIDLIEKETAQGSCDRLLIPFYQNMAPEELPEDLRAMPKQVDASRMANPRQELLRLIGEHFSQNQKEDMADLRRQVRSQSAGSTIRLEESAENDTTRGMVMLIGGDFDQAEEQFRKALQKEPWPDAYLGLLMCELKVPGRDALSNYENSIANQKYYKLALQFADERKMEEILAIGQNCEDNQTNRLHREKMQEEGPKLAGQIKNRIKQGDIHSDAFVTYQEEKKWLKKAEEIARAADDFPEVADNALSFCLIGNLIPSLLLLPLNLSDGGEFRVIYGIGMALMVICYFGGLGGILKQIDFFDDHKIIRYVVCYFVFMGVGTTLYGNHLLPFFVHPLVSVLLCLWWWMKYGKNMVRAEKAKSVVVREAKDKLKNLAALSKDMRQQALAEYDKKRQKYQPYFSEEDWKKIVMDGTALIRETVDEQIADLEKRMKAL